MAQPIVLQVSGMSCEHCKAAVTEAVKDVAGVQKVDVDLDQGRVTVEFAQAPDEAAVRKAITEAGYEVSGNPS